MAVLLGYDARMRIHLVLVALAAVLTCALAPAAHAQLDRAIRPIALPPVSLSAPDDALAVDVNPAALGFLPSWSFVFLMMNASEDAAFGEAGYGFFGAVPLPLGFALGASAQSLDPTRSSGLDDRGFASLALAFAPIPQWSVGTALRFVSSDDPQLDGVVTPDISTIWRPSPWLGFTFMARDFSSPRDLPRSYVFAAGLRPFGTQVATIDLATSVDDDDEVGGRAALDIGIPYFGRISTAIEVNRLGDRDRDWRLTTGLAMQWNNATLAGGVLVGDGFENGAGWYMMERLEGSIRDGIAHGQWVLDMRLEGGLGARRILKVLADLERAQAEPRVSGVFMRLRSTGIGLAYAQEIRLAIDALKKAGKPVVCHLDAATGAEYYACANATRVLIDPAGGIRLVGPSLTVLSLKKLLDNVGVRADFARMGEYKSAPEQLMRSQMSEPAREQRDALLHDGYKRLLVDLAKDRQVTPREMQTLVDEGPYLSNEALRAKLVSGYGDELDIDAPLRQVFAEHALMLEDYPTAQPDYWGVPPRIGVVVVDGDIVDGENVDIPLVDIHMSGGRSVSKAIQGFMEDPTVRAIVVRVDSPGGSAMASDQIWRAIRRARKVKPVIASLGSVAASGGYYVASAADEIWADPTTVTGSIGVFFGKVDVAPLAARIGVGVEALSRGKHADMESLWRPFTDEERAVLRDKVRSWYNMFLARVAEGRKMNIAKVDALGRGRVWSGDSAHQRGLVDRLGGFGSALARARALAHLGSTSELVIRPERPSTLLDYILDSGAQSAQGTSSVLRLSPEVRSAASFVLAAGRLGTLVPLARLPWSHHGGL